MPFDQQQYYIEILKPKRDAKKKAKMKDKLCVICNKPIVSFRRTTRKYCSQECYLVANREKALTRYNKIKNLTNRKK